MSVLPSNSPLSNNVDKTPIKPGASADDVLDLLSEDKDIKPEPKDDVDDEDDEEVKDKKPAKKAAKQDDDKDDDDDDDEDEIKLKGDDDDEDEKLDLKDDDDDIKIETPPRKAEIVKYDPEFLKKFPWFEKMMFRDRQYTELFGSFDDAKEIKASADVLASFEADMSKGDSTKVLEQVKKNAPEAFDKLVDNYLPNLYKVDTEAYYHVIGNVTKHIIAEMKAAKLDDAAKALNKFMFNTDEELKPTNKSKEKPQDDEVKKDREAFIQERFETARTDLQTKVDNVLRATITDYIDPKNEMSPYVKKNAIKDALSALHGKVGTDAAFNRSLNRAWENAFKEKFSQNSLNTIRASYLGKAKTLLQDVIRTARKEALKGATPSSKKEDEDQEERPARKPNRDVRDSGSPRRQSGNNRNQMQKGESVHDFLSRD